MSSSHDDDDEPTRKLPLASSLVLSPWSQSSSGVQPPYFDARIGGLVWLLLMNKAISAIQEAAISASAAFVLIALYVVARAAEKILGGDWRVEAGGVNILSNLGCQYACPLHLSPCV